MKRMPAFLEIKERPMPADNLFEWRRELDPLRTRHGLTNGQYAQATETHKRASFVPDRLVQIVAALLFGVVIGALAKCSDVSAEQAHAAKVEQAAQRTCPPGQVAVMIDASTSQCFVELGSPIAQRP